MNMNINAQQVILNAYITNNSSLYVIYTNRGGGLCQIYKLEAKPSVYRSDINRIPRFVYCF